MAKEELYDLVIIGASAVGCAASVYAARRNLKFVVLAKDIGGEVALSGDVDNWPGIVHTTGIELADMFHKHMQSYNTLIEDDFEVMEIKQKKNIHVVLGKDGDGKTREYESKAVIVGSGIHPRALGVPGESEFRGKGVTSCTVCDGPLFKGKVTATIGAGNSALESALMMADIAEKVYLVTKYQNNAENKGGFPPGENILIDKVKALKNVEILYGANTLEIIGDTVVTGLRYEETSAKGVSASGGKEKKTLAVQGVMVHIGVIPNSDLVASVKKTPLKEIEIDILCQTSTPGIFAAGDVTNVPFRQIAIAAGHGVTAALSAIDYINRWKAL